MKSLATPPAATSLDKTDGRKSQSVIGYAPGDWEDELEVLYEKAAQHKDERERAEEERWAKKEEQEHNEELARWGIDEDE